MSSLSSNLAVHSHVPFGKEGSGLYTKSVTTLQECNDYTWKYAETAIDALPTETSNANEPFVIAHYGSADGGVALPLTCKIVAKVREKYGKKKPIAVYYEDQATNDFVSLFKIATGQMQVSSDSTRSYYCTEENVFIGACGVSFYCQCFLPSSVDLGISATAFHWMKSPPDQMKNSFGLHGDYDPEKVESNVAQAKHFWETILLHRAAEMKPGASLLLAELSRRDDGSRSGRTSNIRESQQDTVHKCWTHLRDNAIITQDEFESAVFAMYHRSEAEHQEPFMDPDSAVTKAGLRLISTETKLWRCHVHLDLMARPDQDARDYARRVVLQYRPWTNFTFLSALSDERTQENRNQIIDQLYQRYEDTIAANPFDNGEDVIYRYLFIKKIDDSLA